MPRKLGTFLGRVSRALWKLAAETDGRIKDYKLRKLLELAERILAQTRTSKDKVYSVHEPEVKCIAKGKVH